jgi:hypothetical protein
MWDLLQNHVSILLFVLNLVYCFCDRSMVGALRHGGNRSNFRGFLGCMVESVYAIGWAWYVWRKYCLRQRLRVKNIVLYSQYTLITIFRALRFACFFLDLLSNHYLALIANRTIPYCCWELVKCVINTLAPYASFLCKGSRITTFWWWTFYCWFFTVNFWSRWSCAFSWRGEKCCDGI